MSKSIIRAGLIVQLIDALTGNPISVEGRKVRLILEKARVPLEKGNGYYVLASDSAGGTIVCFCLWL